MYSGVEISLSITSHNSAEGCYRRIAVSSTSLVLCGILLLALLLRLAYYVGLGFADDLIYAEIVNRIINHSSTVLKSVFHARTFFIYAMSFFAYVFGYGEFSLTLFQLVCSLGGIILIYRLGSLLINKDTGLVGAFLLSFYPLDVIYTTQVMPDIPLAFFLGLNAYWFLKGEIEGRQHHYWYAGVSLGLAYLIKAIALVQLLPLVIFMAGYSVLQRRIKIAHLLCILSVVMVVLLEMFYFKLSTGNFFEHFRLLSETYTKTVYQGDRLRDVLDYYPKLVLLLHYSHFKYLYGFFFYVGGIMVLYVLCRLIATVVKKPDGYAFSEKPAGTSKDTEQSSRNIKRGISILVVWLVFWFLYLQCGSMSLKNYVIMEKHERFLSLINFPFLLLLAFFLTSYRSRIKKVFNVVCVAFLFLTSFYFNEISSQFHSVEIQDIREIKRCLKEKSFDRVYADRDTNYKLDFMFNFEGRKYLTDLNRVSSIERIESNSYVITEGKGFIDLSPSLKRALSDEVSLWKRGWRLDAVVDDHTLERYKLNKPKIYYVP